MEPAQGATDAGTSVGAASSSSPPTATPYGLAILFQPEVYHLLQIVKKYGPSTRFFSDENSMVPSYPLTTARSPIFARLISSETLVTCASVLDSHPVNLK